MPHAELFVTVRVRHAWLLIGILRLMGIGLIHGSVGIPLTNWLLMRLITIESPKGRR